jgi:glycosyltransferase involved in cell wall biosynthesis
MKIALLTQYYNPEMGAPQNRLHEMVSGLKTLDNELLVITGMPNYPTGKIFDRYRGKFSMTETLNNIPVKRYWLFASNTKKVLPRIFSMLSFSFTSFCAIRAIRKMSPDYLIVESPPLTLGFTGYLLAKFSGAKFVMNISDLWPLSARELGILSDGIIYKLLEKLEVFLYKKSFFCMGQSQEIVDYVQKHKAKRVYLFRNGVDPSRFLPFKPDLSPNPLKIVYTGLLGFAQGVYDICQNVRFDTLNIEFHIYGAGGEQKKIEQYLQEHPQKQIFYHGKVNRDEIPQILSQYHVTLIPLVKNIYGAVPSKIYESMAAGLPILFSGEGEGKTIIEENNIGWTSAAKDYAAIEENLSYLIAHPDEIRQKQNLCRECATHKFNRPQQIIALNHFMTEILKSE